MAKIVYAILLVFFIEFALYFFGGTTYSQTSLMSMILNPESITTTPLFIGLLVILGAFAAAVIIVGNFYNINVYALYASMIIIFISFITSLVHLYSFVGGALSAKLSAELVQLLQVVFIGPLIIFYIMSCVEWVRSNQ